MIKRRQNATPFELCLLGLLAGKPMDGYALRKVLAETPMRRFSDSPGSVYPALERLRRRGWVTRERDPSHPRRRSTFAVTRAGRTELQDWLGVRLSIEEVAYRTEYAMLRLAFLHLLPRADVPRFLADLHRLAAQHARQLQTFLDDNGARYPANAALALEHGVRHFKHLARWADSARRRFERPHPRGAHDVTED